MQGMANMLGPILQQMQFQQQVLSQLVKNNGCGGGEKMARSTGKGNRGVSKPTLFPGLGLNCKSGRSG